MRPVQPVGCSSHALVPYAQLTINGVAENELKDVDRFHRRARGLYVPLEEFVGSREIPTHIDEKALQPWVADESGTHRLKRRHRG